MTVFRMAVLAAAVSASATVVPAVAQQSGRPNTAPQGAAPQTPGATAPQGQLADATVQKVTVVASTIINNFVTTLGYQQVPVDKRTVKNDDGIERLIFQPVPVVHDANAIGEQRRGFAVEYAGDWCDALKATVVENASSANGTAIDAKQNQRLGEILDQIRG